MCIAIRVKGLDMMQGHLESVEIITAVSVSLHVEEYGSGDPLILCHGFAGSARNFRPQARAFRDRRRVVLFDARGHARSEAPEDPAAYRREHFVEDLKGIVARESNGVSDALVVGGLSMGAAIALDYACEADPKPRGLVLAAFPPGGDTTNAWASNFADAIDRDGLDDAGARYVWGGDRFDERGASLIRQGFLEHSPAALAHTLRGVLARQPRVSDLIPRIRDLEIPTLLVVGADDSPSLAASRELAESLPRAELRVVPGAGHVVNLQKPKEFNESLADFLSGIEQAHSGHG